jgi:catechol 2,3-dioxygenase-like lactoylglutathione lyase family enzyme
MFDHIGLHVRDLEASTRFYEAALASLGYVLCSSDKESAAFGPKDAPQLYLYTAKKPAAASHVALRAPTRRAVAQFHKQGLAHGAKDHGAPGLRADYAPNYFAAFLLDPDGNNVEAVCYADD